MLERLVRNYQIWFEWQRNLCAFKKLKTFRKDYVHLKDFHDLVRERLCLRKSVSLRLRFVGSRIYGRDWREHDVSFCSDDTVCVQYLEGAIFLGACVIDRFYL